MRKISWVSMSVLALATVAMAQQEPSTHAPDPPTHGMVEGIMVPSIPGAAFSGHATLVTKTVLPNGTTIQRQSTMLLARNSMGQVYRERRRIQPLDQEGEPLLVARIVFNRQEETQTECVLGMRICTITRKKATAVKPEEPAGTTKDGKYTLARTTIGTETMEGVEVQHVREKRTYAIGAFGNDKPVASIVDYWFAPVLQVNLATLVTNPNGTTMYMRVTELNLSEPEGSLFEPVAGFRVVDARTPQGAQ
jgi:hypothetical protein